MTQKYLMTIILLGITLLTSGQNLVMGTYRSITSFESTAITINAQNGFNYTHSTCTGGYAGMGSYTFKKKELVLNFKDSINKRTFFAPNIVRENGDGQIKRISIVFYRTNDKSPIDFVNIKVHKNGTDKLFIVQPDSSGRAWISAEQKEFPVFMEVYRIGSIPQRIQLDTADNYLIEVPVTIDLIRQLCDNDMIRFEVIEIKKNQILMKTEGDKKSRRYIRRD